MDEILKIHNWREYRAFAEAITRYDLEEKALRTTLIGTYWKVDINKEDPYWDGTFYYFVNKESSKMYHAFCIENRKRGVEISSSSSLMNPYTKDPKNKITFLSQKQFVVETAPLIKKYGLKWDDLI